MQDPVDEFCYCSSIWITPYKEQKGNCLIRKVPSNESIQYSIERERQNEMCVCLWVGLQLTMKINHLFPLQVLLSCESTPKRLTDFESMPQSIFTNVFSIQSKHCLLLNVLPLTIQITQSWGDGTWERTKHNFNGEIAEPLSKPIKSERGDKLEAHDTPSGSKKSACQILRLLRPRRLQIINLTSSFLFSLIQSVSISCHTHTHTHTPSL